MNIGITTSFIVGGLLLLSILHMNFTVSSNSSQTTIQIMAKNRMLAVTETLNSDFNRMGFGVPDNQDDITSITDSTAISFQADLDDNGSIETVTWSFNANDSTLVRTAPDSPSGIEYPVAEFKLTYYNLAGTQISNPDNVRRIEVELVCESPIAISQSTTGSKQYGRSYWHKTIVPPSLQF